MKEVQSVNISKEILIKAMNSSLLSGEELKKGRKIMREFKLVLERKDEVINAISRIKQKVVVYQRKLNTYVKRNEFAKVNKHYELRRCQFYRDLRGDE